MLRPAEHGDLPRQIYPPHSLILEEWEGVNDGVDTPMGVGEGVIDPDEQSRC